MKSYCLSQIVHPSQFEFILKCTISPSQTLYSCSQVQQSHRYSIIFISGHGQDIQTQYCTLVASLSPRSRLWRYFEVKVSYMVRSEHWLEVPVLLQYIQFQQILCAFLMWLIMENSFFSPGCMTGDFSSIICIYFFIEAERLGELNQKAQSGFYCPPATKNMHSDLGTRRYEDIMKIKNARYTHQSKRGDFLMHPEWTPNMPHHRLNGLSSVDLPYIPGRRWLANGGKYFSRSVQSTRAWHKSHDAIWNQNETPNKQSEPVF